MTYIEYYMQKRADSDPSFYEDIAAKKNAGDPATLKALGTTSGQEIFWNLLGAGLGAGGAYLLSKRFRRDATRRQRALDLLIGAIVGAGGTQLALSLPGDEKSGLSLKETMRADTLGEGRTSDNAKGVEHLNPWRLNWMTGGGAAGGALIGGTIGGFKGPYGRKLRKSYHDEAVADGLADVARREKAGTRLGNSLDFGLGSLIGAGAGYGIGVTGNAIRDNILADQYAGGMN